MKIKTLTMGVVGGVMALMLVTITFPAPRAQAATYSELQAQIQTLLTQIATLQAKLIALQGGTAYTCTIPVSDLAYGESGYDVTNLQKFLISRGYSIPAGATGYFGGQTQNALALFQANQGIAPAAGLNYGPLTRAKIQTLCAVVPAPTPTPTPTPDPTPEPNPTPVPTLSGEASLENFSVKDGNDTDLEEADKAAEVMEVSFRVRDGDAKLNRLEVGFTPDAGNDEDRPWDTFKTVSVWSGSKKLATADTTKKSNWREDEPTNGSYVLRLSGLSYIMDEDDEVELTIKVDIQNNVDGTSDGELWNVFIPDNGLRALDADNVAIHAGDTADAVTLNIDKEGSSDELLVRRSNEDLDASVIQVDNSRSSGYKKVFVFDLDTDDSKQDIEIRNIPVDFTVSSGTLSDFVRQARIIIDGKTYTDDTLTIDGSTGTIEFEFDRNDLVIDTGNRVAAVVEIDFNALESMYEGVTIVGSVDADNIDAEGADDLDTDQLQGSATGELHALYTKGSDVSENTTSAVVSSVSGALNDYATFSVSVNVTAFGQDVYLPANTTAVSYELLGNGGTALSDTGIAVVESSARERNSYFFIPEGSTERITLLVSYQPGTANTVARLQLKSLHFSNTQGAPTQQATVLPASKYRTAPVIIVD